jgi:hypothetical protein
MLTGDTVIYQKAATIKLNRLVKSFDFGDVYKVLGYSENDHENHSSEVTSTRRCSAKDFVCIKTENDDTLIITPSQKIYSADQKKWILASTVTISTKLLHVTGVSLNISEVHEIHNRYSRDVYTLTINETHSYYANGILVHNADIGPDGSRGPNTSTKKTTYGDSHSDRTWSGVLPPNATFYWQLLPPQKTSMTSQADMSQDTAKSSSWGPAPRLSPLDWKGSLASNNFQDSAVRKATHINVRDTHHWTESPLSSRREVPILSLKEYNIMLNPMVNQIFQNVAMIGGKVVKLGGLVDNGIKLAKELGSALKTVWTDGAAKGMSELNVPINEETTMTIDELMSSNAGKLLHDIRKDSSYADPLNPYTNLYTTYPTHFRYSFPYQQNTYMSKNGNFSATSSREEMGYMGESALGLTDVIADVARDLSMSRMGAPGQMIEKPKQFNFDGRERSYTITFPLFNTKSYAEIIKNWQFLFLLTYQNTPNRISRDLIDPPCIYEAFIPGVWYSQYASITNLQVDFMGARRDMDMIIPYLDKADDINETGAANWIMQKRKFTTIIPDAYMVTMTISELFSETQNFMHHMLRESMNDKVSVSTTLATAFGNDGVEAEVNAELLRDNEPGGLNWKPGM